MKFLLSISPSREMGEHSGRREKKSISAGIEPTTSKSLPPEQQGSTGASQDDFKRYMVICDNVNLKDTGT